MDRRVISHLPLLIFLVFLIACSRRPDDTTIQKDIQTKAAADPETKESDITVASEKGKVTLKGKVSSQAADDELKKIAKQERGVSVVNDQTSVEPNTAPPTAPTAAAPATLPQSDTAGPQSAPTSQMARIEPPPEPAPLTVVPPGTALTVRLGQPLSSENSQRGTVFTATLANPITIKGAMVIPEGAETTGVVREAKKAGRFKGGAVLAPELTTITVNGHKYNIQTDAVSESSTGKGKRTAGMIAGGGGVGAAIGGIAGGGKGAAIGALTGAAAGTIGSAFTGNRNITLPAEAAVIFKLVQPLTLRPSQ